MNTFSTPPTQHHPSPQRFLTGWITGSKNKASEKLFSISVQLFQTGNTEK
ncbi:MAG: hypothetical protein HON53_21335 [Planctomycetaceae bacterium]|jgi:hypothetical protein|nr:hypothetical protein [Planctomycetaceae bacterium]MBT6155927.1 hypothetical protein [Planctomycetaceae bacterium]MBT6483158.1 hypothetical protein [Planctomycetaceae bacterium]MBT6497760.1 hypothetical protein [Planctomycetaceae bacterium]